MSEFSIAAGRWLHKSCAPPQYYDVFAEMSFVRTTPQVKRLSISPGHVGGIHHTHQLLTSWERGVKLPSRLLRVCFKPSGNTKQWKKTLQSYMVFGVFFYPFARAYILLLHLELLRRLIFESNFHWRYSLGVHVVLPRAFERKVLRREGFAIHLHILLSSTVSYILSQFLAPTHT